MRLARPLAKLRYALLIPLALAALVSTPTFAQTEVIIREAPPPMPPACSLAPDTQEAFLGHVPGLVGIPEDPTGEREQTRQFARHHFVDGRRFVVTDAGQQLNVRISVFQ